LEHLRLQADERGVLVVTADVRKYSPTSPGTIRQTVTVCHRVPNHHANKVTDQRRRQCRHINLSAQILLFTVHGARLYLRSYNGHTEICTVSWRE
jgi:hypothetical protein